MPRRKGAKKTKDEHKPLLFEAPDSPQRAHGAAGGYGHGVLEERMPRQPTEKATFMGEVTKLSRLILTHQNGAVTVIILCAALCAVVLQQPHSYRGVRACCNDRCVVRLVHFSRLATGVSLAGRMAEHNYLQIGLCSCR